MKVQECCGVHTLMHEGDLTIFEAAEFQENLIALHQLEGVIDLDLSNVDRMDSSCVQLIIAGTKSGRMAVKGVTGSIQENFTRIGCGDLLEKVSAERKG